MMKARLMHGLQRIGFPFREVLLLLLLPVIPAVLSVWWHPQGPSWNTVVLKEGEVDLAAVAKWDRVLWVDARSPAVFAEGHIPGAINLYFGNFEEQAERFLDVWDPDIPVVVYCSSLQCGASTELANKLRQEWGMENVYVLKGGWEAWREANP